MLYPWRPGYSWFMELKTFPVISLLSISKSKDMNAVDGKQPSISISLLTIYRHRKTTDRTKGSVTRYRNWGTFCMFCKILFFLCADWRWWHRGHSGWEGLIAHVNYVIRNQVASTCTENTTTSRVWSRGRDQGAMRKNRIHRRSSYARERGRPRGQGPGALPSASPPLHGQRHL